MGQRNNAAVEPIGISEDKSADEINKTDAETTDDISAVTSDGRCNASAPTRSIDLYRETDSGCKRFHVQILEDVEILLEEVKDTHAIVIFRHSDGTWYDVLEENLLLVVRDVEADYQRARAEIRNRKSVSNFVVLTNAEFNGL